LFLKTQNVLFLSMPNKKILQTSASPYFRLKTIARHEKNIVADFTTRSGPASVSLVAERLGRTVVLSILSSRIRPCTGARSTFVPRSVGAPILR
jgi:hypothetical protein